MEKKMGWPLWERTSPIRTLTENIGENLIDTPRTIA